MSNRVFPALVGLKLVVRELLLDPLVNVSQSCLEQCTSKIFWDSIMLIWGGCIGYIGLWAWVFFASRFN